MGLEDPTQIDFVVTPPTGRGLYLVVFDAGEISDELRRYQLVLQKLMSYAEYVASAQFREESPGVSPEDITLCVVCKTPPGNAMKQIVSIASRQAPEVHLPVIVETQQEFFNRTKTA